MSTAIVLIAHGSRRKAANDDLVLLAERMRRRQPDAQIEIAYLELATPSIPEALQKSVDEGANNVRLLPFFLSPGSHVTEDLERYRRQFAQQHPAVEFTLCPPLGLHPLIEEILLERLNEQMAGAE